MTTCKASEVFIEISYNITDWTEQINNLTGEHQMNKEITALLKTMLTMINGLLALTYVVVFSYLAVHTYNILF